jgi:hypothetical protein
VAWQERNRSFEHIGMVGPARLNIMMDGPSRRNRGAQRLVRRVRCPGVQPVVGRGFTTDEDLEGNDGVIVLSYEFLAIAARWSARCGWIEPDHEHAPPFGGGCHAPTFTVEGQRADFMVPYGWTLERLRSAPGRGSSHAIAAAA